jgi:hypothetical protein
MRKRVLIAEPDPDVRRLLELAVHRAGHDTAERDAHDGVDAILMEPGCAVAHALLRRFRDAMPPVVCVSIHPREVGLAPPGTVAYVLKPAAPSRIARTLAEVHAA